MMSIFIIIVSLWLCEVLVNNPTYMKTKEDILINFVKKLNR